MSSARESLWVLACDGKSRFAPLPKWHLCAYPHLVHFHIWAAPSLPLVLSTTPPIHQTFPDGLRPRVLEPPLRPSPHQGMWVPHHHPPPVKDSSPRHRTSSRKGTTNGCRTGVRYIRQCGPYAHHLVHSDVPAWALLGSAFNLQRCVIHSPRPFRNFSYQRMHQDS